MPVVTTIQTRYSDEKLDTLKQHYLNLFEFLQKHTEAWDHMCKAYSRHIFYFPWILCRNMLNLCNAIICVYNQPPHALSHAILHIGRKILEIMNNDYMSLAVIANTILQRGGFTFKNLNKLYIHWNYDSDMEHQTAISFCLSDIPPISLPEKHHQFMNMFRIRDHFLAAPYVDSHDMLCHDNCVLMDLRAATPDLPPQVLPWDSDNDGDAEADREVAQINSIFTEGNVIDWNKEFNDERSRYLANFEMLTARWEARDFQRNLSQGSIGNSSNNSSEVGEIPYLPLEEGDFDDFEDHMQNETTSLPGSVAFQQSEVVDAPVDQLTATLGAINIAQTNN